MPHPEPALRFHWLRPDKLPTASSAEGHPSKGELMRRTLITTLALTLITSMMLGMGVHRASAQDEEATPDVIEGVAFENLGVAFPDAPGDSLLQLMRVTIQPDAELPAHTQPGTALVHVEQGTVGLTITEGDVRGGVQILRAGGNAGTPTADDEVSLETEFTLASGDTVALDRDVVRTFRNTGSEEAVLTIAVTAERNRPSFDFADDSTVDS